MSHPTSDTIDHRLRVALAPHLGLAPADIDPDKSFTRYGLDSMTAITLAADLEDWLGRRLSPTLAWDYPTIRTLAAYLADLAAGRDQSETIASGDGEPLGELSEAQVDALLRGLLNDEGIQP